MLNNTLKEKEKLQAEIENHSKTKEEFIQKSKDMEDEIKRLRDSVASDAAKNTDALIEKDKIQSDLISSQTKQKELEKETEKLRNLLASEASKSTEAMNSALKDKEKLQTEAASHSHTREALIQKSLDMEREVKRLNDLIAAEAAKTEFLLLEKSVESPQENGHVNMTIEEIIKRKEELEARLRSIHAAVAAISSLISAAKEMLKTGVVPPSLIQSNNASNNSFTFSLSGSRSNSSQNLSSSFSSSSLSQLAGRPRSDSTEGDHPDDQNSEAGDLDSASFMGDDDSIASVAVMSLSERQSRVLSSRESLEKKLGEYVRKTDRWRSEKEVDVLAEVDSEFSDIEHVVKNLIEQEGSGEASNLSEVGEQLFIMNIQFDTIEKVVRKEVARFEQEVFEVVEEMEEMHKQAEIVSNLEDMRKKQRPIYVAKQGDAVDDLISQFIHKYQNEDNVLPPNFKRLQEGVYEFGTKKIRAQILNGILVVRVGGGYMKFEEFVKKYAQKESIKVIRTPGFRAHLVRSTSESYVNIIVNPAAASKLNKSISAPQVPKTQSKTPAKSAPTTPLSSSFSKSSSSSSSSLSRTPSSSSKIPIPVLKSTPSLKLNSSSSSSTTPLSSSKAKPTTVGTLKTPRSSATTKGQSTPSISDNSNNNLPPLSLTPITTPSPPSSPRNDLSSSPSAAWLDNAKETI